MGRSIKGLVANVAMLGAAVLISSLALDRVLIVFGLPAVIPPRYAHPAHFTQQREHLEFSYEFATNDQGLRYDVIPLEKPAGSRRVFVLGDSFTEGIGVEASATFTALLERDLSARFINGGLSGTGPMHHARLLFNVGWRYDPDAVLICVFPNDLNDTDPAISKTDLYEEPAVEYRGIKRPAHALWPRTYTVLQGMRRYQALLGRMRPESFIRAVRDRAAQRGVPEQRVAAWEATVPLDFVAAVDRGEYNGGVLTRGLFHPEHWIDALDVESPIALARWEAMSMALMEIVDQSRARGLPVGIVLIPSIFQYDPRSHEPDYVWVKTGTFVRQEWLTESSKLQQLLGDWSARNEVPFLDLTSTLRDSTKAGVRLNWKHDGHLNEAGHIVTAGAIAGWLRESRPFPFIESSTN